MYLLCFWDCLAVVLNLPAPNLKNISDGDDKMCDAEFSSNLHHWPKIPRQADYPLD